MSPYLQFISLNSLNVTAFGDNALKEMTKLNDTIRVSSNSVWLMSLWSYLQRDTRDEHVKEITGAGGGVGIAIYKSGKETLEENSPVNTFITNNLTSGLWEK